MQTYLHMADETLQVPGCRECLRRLSEARRDGPLSFRKCAVLEKLCCQVKEFQEEVSRLHHTREDEKEIDRIFCET